MAGTDAISLRQCGSGMEEYALSYTDRAKRLGFATCQFFYTLFLLPVRRTFGGYLRNADFAGIYRLYEGSWLFQFRWYALSP